MISQILLSNVIHKRYIPFKHVLKYNVPSLFLNLDDLEKLGQNYSFFSLNSFNIYFHFMNPIMAIEIKDLSKYS